MLDLHERLSEFSYGYGVTREIEQALGSVGIKTTPFLPSLLHEAKLGFDVQFKKPGGVILVQFKLGQCLSRFVRADKSKSAPKLDKPFWRFKIDTAETEGQFETLLRSELEGAETYYVAPRFNDWSQYLIAYETEEVLERSILIRPSEIRNALIANGSPDGRHAVVYDNHRRYVCSAPKEINEVTRDQLIKNISQRISISSSPLRETIYRVFAGLDSRHLVRREKMVGSEDMDEETFGAHSTDPGFSFSDPSIARKRRVASWLERGNSEEEAVVAALGIEVWSLGIQMILATKAQ